MSGYKAEIIAVGTELLLGQISNTNAQWLSERLADHGVNVFYHSVVGDNLDRVSKAFELAGKRSDIVFVTGGLGPTDDDLTREAFQALSQKELREDQVSIDKIAAFYRDTKRQMTPNNRKQALVFNDAVVLPNSVGMAPGMIIEYNGVIWIFMPGVPREMKSITDDYVLPYLRKMLDLSTVIQSRMLRFIGIGESQLEHQLKPLIDTQQNPTIAPLASEGEVAIRLTAKASTTLEAKKLIALTEERILNQVGSYFYGYDDETIEKRIVHLLMEKSLTIAAAESLTGGKFTDTIVSVKGASKVCMGGIVSYSSEIKKKVLDVTPETIHTEGTVSNACASQMARNVKQKLSSDIGISFTGVAGPESIEGKQVGTVIIGLHQPLGDTVTKEYHFQGDRDSIRVRTVKKGLELLYQLLKK